MVTQKVAGFGSKCRGCGGWVERGEPIALGANGWGHARCASSEGGEDVVAAVVKEVSEGGGDGLKWSAMQQAVFEHVEHSQRSLIVRARAGSGKSTTMVEAARRAARRGKRVIIVAFNKDIAVTLNEKLDKCGAVGVVAGTFHSVWYRALLRSGGVKPRLDDRKVMKLGRAMVDGGAVSHEVAKGYLAGAVKLVGAAKAEGVGCVVADEVGVWVELAERYEVEFEEAWVGVELARRLLAASVAESGVIDFDDMLYMSGVNGAACDKFDVVMIDEAQDFNRMQRWLLHKMVAAGGKLVAIGDEFQSIYGFRGAAFDSMDRIAEEFDCESLPLSISYRCPRRVVELARALVADIESAEGAADGVVWSIGGEGDEDDEDKGVWRVMDFLPTDAVLCRNTAPLIQLAFKCIRGGVGVRVMGRDFGDGLVALVKKMDALDAKDLGERLEQWRAVESARLVGRGEDRKAESVNDRCECIQAIIEGLGGEDWSVDAVVEAIVELFQDAGSGVLTLSTVHRAKGKEWERVFLLDRWLMPSKHAKSAEAIQQERNVEYVALTRAMKELVFVDSEQIV